MITSLDDLPDYSFSFGLYEIYDIGLTGVIGFGIGAGSLFVVLKTLFYFLVNLDCDRSPFYEPLPF